MIEGKVSAFVLLLALVGFTRCCASDPKKCLFSVVQEDGSKHTYDFSGEDYDMAYDGTDFQIIMNLCNTAARACYPSTCYDTGNDLHNFEGKPCLPECNGKHWQYRVLQHAGWWATRCTRKVLSFGHVPDNLNQRKKLDACKSHAIALRER